MLKNKYFEFNRDGKIIMLWPPNETTIHMMALIINDCMEHAKKHKIRKPRDIRFPGLLTEQYYV